MASSRGYNCSRGYNFCIDLLKKSHIVSCFFVIMLAYGTSRLKVRFKCIRDPYHQGCVINKGYTTVHVEPLE